MRSCSSPSSGDATPARVARCVTSVCRRRRWCGGSRGWCAPSSEHRRIVTMRTLRLVALVLGLLVVTAIASPWITLGANALGFPFKVSRVYNRGFQLLLVGAILFGWRRLDLGNARQIGLRHPRWARDLGAGLLVGLLGVGAGVLVCWLGGAMVPALRFAVPKTIWKAAAGMLGAVLVGVGEEA